MRHLSLFLILLISVFGTACDNEIIDNAANFQFETIDNEANKIDLSVTIRYRLESRLEKKLSRKFGRHYKDSLLLPTILAISTKVLKDYAAGEIYNYKRDEIEQKIGGQTKTTFADYNLELTDFFIRSVGLSDTLLRRLEQEHVTRFQNAISNCSREIMGVVTELDEMKPGDNILFYEFVVENKNYKGILDLDPVGQNVSIGDSIVIEFACEDAIFHRVKK